MWIEEYRNREGLELYELAEKVNKYRREYDPFSCGIVSDQLLHILERSRNAVTHPRIANAIAEVCGATPEQRDMIVHKIHRGTWEPTRPGEREKVDVSKPKIGYKPVVKVDRYGNIIDRYESLTDAVRYEAHRENSIRDRCKRRIDQEFTPQTPYTYRYADEWDNMTDEERLRDVGGDFDG